MVINVKDELIDIIKEAIQLDSNETETIPGTNINVRKGRAGDYISLAYRYYQNYKQENNIIDTEKTRASFDYLTFIYNLLEPDAKRSLEDDYKDNQQALISNAFELMQSAKNNYDNLTRLNNNLDRINKNYDKLVDQAASLQTRLGSIEYSVWKNRFDEINASIAEYAENKKIITDAIINIKREMNEAFLKEIDKELASIREDFKTQPKIDNPAYGKDGHSILPSQEKEYNSLLDLAEIIKNTTELARLVPVGKVFCVNLKDFDSANKLLRNISNLKALSQPDTEFYAESNRHINDEIIKKISQELEKMKRKGRKKTYTEMPSGAYINSKDEPRYNNLIEILRVLNRANASDEELTPVWGVVSVLGQDKPRIIDLMRKEDIFNSYNPDYEKKQFNAKMIEELEEYLLSLEKKYTNKHIDKRSYTNIPSRQTSDDKIVLADDYEEYEIVYKMLNYLKDNNNPKNNRYDLENVWGLGYVSHNEVPEYKKLLNSSKKYGSKIPKIPENEAIVEQIKKALIALNETAKNTNNPVLASNEMVLADDEEEYDLLIKQLKYLEASKDYTDDLELISDGARIASRYAGYYRNAINELKELRKNKTAKNNKKQKDLEKTRVKLTEVEKQIADLSTENMASPGIKEKLDLLEALKMVLERAEKTNDLVDIGDGIMIDKDDQEAYNKITAKLKELENPKKDLNKEKLAEIKTKIEELKSLDMTIPENKNKLSILENLKFILENAQKSQKLVDAIDGAKVDWQDEEEYNRLTAILKGLEKVSQNNLKLAEVNKQLKDLEKEDLHDNNVQAKQVALNTMKKILEDAEKTNDLVDIGDGVKVPRGQENNYQYAKEVLDNLSKSPKDSTDKKRFSIKNIRKLPGKAKEWLKNHSPKTKSRVKSTRKLKGTAKEWWKTHYKAVACLGLMSLAVLLSSGALVPPLAYACCALGNSFPVLAPVMSTIVNGMCSLGFVSNVGGAILTKEGIALSANFALSRTAEFALSALAGMGLIGISDIISKRILRREDNNRLPLPIEDKNNRKKLSDKVLGLLDKFKAKTRKNKDDNQLDFKNNEELTAKINNSISTITKYGEPTDNFNKKRVSLLRTIKDILEKSYNAYDEDLELIQGIYISNTLQDSYAKASDALQALENSIITKTTNKLREIDAKLQELATADMTNDDNVMKEHFLQDIKTILMNSLNLLASGKIDYLVEEKDVLVSSGDASNLRDLVDKLEGLEEYMSKNSSSNKNPINSTLNQSIIDDIENQIKELKNQESGIFDSVEEEILLEKIKGILLDARKSNNLKAVNGAMIDEDAVPEYEKLMEELKKLKETASKEVEPTRDSSKGDESPAGRETSEPAASSTSSTEPSQEIPQDETSAHTRDSSKGDESPAGRETSEPAASSTSSAEQTQEVHQEETIIPENSTLNQSIIDEIDRKIEYYESEKSGVLLKYNIIGRLGNIKTLLLQARKSNDLKEVNGAMIYVYDAPLYEKTLSRLQELEEEYSEKSTLNQSIIDEIDRKIEYYESLKRDGLLRITIKDKLSLIKQMLLNAREKKNLKEVNGAMIYVYDVPLYVETLSRLQELEEEYSEKLASKYGATTGVEEDETAERVQRRVDDITANTENDPAIANVTGTDIPTPEPLIGLDLDIDRAKILEILENDRKPDGELYDDVAQFVIESRNASVSAIQRQFGLTFSKASHLLDMLEEKGVVGPYDSSIPGEREILVNQTPTVQSDSLPEENQSAEFQGKMTQEEIEQLLSGKAIPPRQPEPVQAAEEDEPLIGSEGFIQEDGSAESQEANDMMINSFKKRIEEIQAILVQGNLTDAERQALEDEMAANNAMLDTLTQGMEGRGI